LKLLGFKKSAATFFILHARMSAALKFCISKVSSHDTACHTEVLSWTTCSTVFT